MPSTKVITSKLQTKGHITREWVKITKFRAHIKAKRTNIMFLNKVKVTSIATKSIKRQK